VPSLHFGAKLPLKLLPKSDSLNSLPASEFPSESRASSSASQNIQDPSCIIVEVQFSNDVSLGLHLHLLQSIIVASEPLLVCCVQQL
jgi:hypothetical protein